MVNRPDADNETRTGIGRTSATERDAITADKFTFWLSDGVIVNPFDIVAVDQVNQAGQEPSRTYGLVTTLEHRTDAVSHLANYISNNFGQLNEEPNTNRQGTTVATAGVLANTADIYMPVPSERLVTFAQPEDIRQALGTDTLVAERKQDAIPAGLIKMSNGAAAVAHLDRRYLLGPESAHVNVSGISGLATKTSYAMFLLQSILHTVVSKLAQKHQVGQLEVGEVLNNQPRFRRIARGNIRGEDLYSAMGQSDSGRHLVVFFVYKPSREALIVSARDSSVRERQAYDRA